MRGGFGARVRVLGLCRHTIGRHPRGFREGLEDRLVRVLEDEGLVAVAGGTAAGRNGVR